MRVTADLALYSGIVAVLVWAVLIVGEALWGRRRLSMSLTGFLASVGLFATALGYWANVNAVVLPFGTELLSYIASFSRGALIMGGLLHLAGLIDERRHRSFLRRRLLRIVGAEPVNYRHTRQAAS